MLFNGCFNKVICIISSIIVGIIATFLTYFAVVTVTPAFLWVLFGIAVGYLAVALASASLIQGTVPCKGFCSTLYSLLIGILGTVLLSIVLLAITFAVGSIIGALLTGALLFFFSLTLTSTACLVVCIVGCNK